MEFKQKKVLFFNAKREKCDSESPHLGLAILASVLKQRGHQVLVVDYQFKHQAPTPKYFVENFKPDVIGLTLYTATMKEANDIRDQISKFRIPLMVGGPHATIYYDDLRSWADYIFIGESEKVIVEVVETVEIQSEAQMVFTTPPNPQDLPDPDFTAFYAYEDITVYPLLTSRGCPYKCSFCLIKFVSTRKWRSRNPDDCIEELLEAKRQFPKIESVIIYDDNPMFKKEHIKKFLNLYLEKKINLPLNVINMRADALDEEIISLLRSADCPMIGIGVESGHPEVFKDIGKGETLDDIKKATTLIKKYHIPLSLCFVIGLEGDSLEKTRVSVEFAKKLKPDHIYWNMITPFKGTRIREWYDENGTVFDLVNHSSWVDGDFMCEEPCAETPKFSIEERKKAYLLAILKTNDTRLSLTDIPRLIPYINDHGLYREFFYWIPSLISKDLHIICRIYREEGLGELIKRFRNYYNI